jgi:hypothetical protein
MKLIDLHPKWVEAEHDHQGNPASRKGIGIIFDCPCGCDMPIYVAFANPLDGGPAHDPRQATWQRTGETFETLMLSPSIRRLGGCPKNWHGWVRNGETFSC